MWSQYKPVNPESFDRRTAELASLTDGWLNGEGVAPDPFLTRIVMRLIRSLFGPEDLLPCAFPTPEGGISVEWSCNGVRGSAEIDLLTMKAEFCAVRVGSGVIAERTLDHLDWWWMVEPISVWANGDIWQGETQPPAKKEMRHESM